MVNYELKKVNPPSFRDVDATTSEITVAFITGVVGCPIDYGMLARDVIVVIVDTDNGSKSKNQLEADMLVKIQEFIAQKYPPTE